MRKNDLIKMLNEIEGNPEVVMWNGMVGDWMIPAKPEQGELCKQTKQHYIEMVRLEKCIDLQNWDFQFSEEELKELDKSYKHYVNWSYGEYVREEDIASKRYKTKKVIWLSAKLRGESYYDRLGKVSY